MGALGPEVRSRPSDPSSVVRAVSAPAPDLQPPLCVNCGAAVDTTGAFCWKCGVPLHTGRDPFLPIPGVTPEADEPRDASLGVYGLSERSGSPTIAGAYGTKHRASRRATLGSVLLLLGVALMVVTLLIGWYSISATGSDAVYGSSVSINIRETFYPLDQVATDFSCTGSAYCTANGTSTAPYSGSGLNNLGTLYTGVACFVIAAIVLALVATALTWLRPKRRTGLPAMLIVVAALLILLAPTVVLASQPSILNSESTNSGGSGNATGPSPRTSFFGSCSGSGCDVSLLNGETLQASWGPSLGWYLCLVAGAALLAGLLLVRTPGVRFPRTAGSPPTP